MPDVMIKPDERVDDLQYKGLKLIQNKKGFCFGLDAVLLADFADVKNGDRVLDIGTGTGIIPVLLAGKTKAQSIVGLEIQEELADLASRNVALNCLDSRVTMVCGDIKTAERYFKAGQFDVITSNPPYMKQNGGLINPSDTKALSRHEITCTIEDITEKTAWLLAPGGQLALVHRPQRLVDIVWCMRKHGIEPKYLRFVHPSRDKKPNLILIKGMKGGKAELKMMEPLYVYDDKGKYSKEIDEIYERGRCYDG